MYSFATISLVFFVLQKNYTKHAMFCAEAVVMNNSILLKSRHRFDYWSKEEKSSKAKVCDNCICMSVFPSVCPPLTYFCTVFGFSWKLQQTSSSWNACGICVCMPLNEFGNCCYISAVQVAIMDKEKTPYNADGYNLIHGAQHCLYPQCYSYNNLLTNSRDHFVSSTFV